MAEDVQGFEEKGDASPWCVQCADFLKWPGHDECHGCLQAGGRPAETVLFLTVHWDTPTIHAIIRRKVGVWEARHPGWVLVPDMQRYWEDATHPSKYVDRETGMGRKHARTRFRVERRHPRGLAWIGRASALAMRGSPAWGGPQGGAVPPFGSDAYREWLGLIPGRVVLDEPASLAREPGEDEERTHA